MRKKMLERRIEREFDGEAEPIESSDGTGVSVAAESYREELRRLREGVQAVAVREGIDDGQFPAFMAGIRERLVPSKGHRGLWVAVSATAAALIVAGAAFLMLAGEPPKAAATVVVEDATTEIEGASVFIEYLDSGDARVRVRVGERDIL